MESPMDLNIRLFNERMEQVEHMPIDQAILFMSREMRRFANICKHVIDRIEEKNGK